ncbi:hypothetical protein OA90_11490 [Labrenzia sp. OB1]|nr:hypothetical protein OA90_11490 [Labrenzia sp. OB1]
MDEPDFHAGSGGATAEQGRFMGLPPAELSRIGLRFAKDSGARGRIVKSGPVSGTARPGAHGGRSRRVTGTVLPWRSGAVCPDERGGRKHKTGGTAQISV